LFWHYVSEETKTPEHVVGRKKKEKGLAIIRRKAPTPAEELRVSLSSLGVD
jgi:hypothetical protein